MSKSVNVETFLKTIAKDSPENMQLIEKFLNGLSEATPGLDHEAAASRKQSTHDPQK